MDPVSEILDDKGRDIYSVDAESTVFAAVGQMCEHKVGSLLVCEAGKPVATFTERDLMTRVVLEHRDPERTQVRDVMTPATVTILPSTDVREAMAMMSEHHCRHLPVAVDGRLVGIISIGDLVRWASRVQASENWALKDTITYGH